MSDKKIVIVAALSENRVIGRGGKLPWYLPHDLVHFSNLTRNHPVIMGRVTYESIGCRPLPGRTANIILTEHPHPRVPLCREFSEQDEEAKKAVNMARTNNPWILEGWLARSPEQAIEIANKVDKYNDVIFVIGGERVYSDFLPLSTHMVLTHVHTTILDGDTFFPEVDWSKWKELHKQHYPAESGRFAHTIVHYERI